MASTNPIQQLSNVPVQTPVLGQQNTFAIGWIQWFQAVFNAIKYLASNGGPALAALQAEVTALQGTAIQIATVTLTAAQLNNLNATPVQLLASPGVGKVILLINCFAEYIFVTTPFTVTLMSGVNAICLAYQAEGVLINGGVQFLGISDLGFIDQLSSQITFGYNSGGTSTLANSENQAIMASTVDTYSGGDGSVKLTIYYQTLTA